MGSFHNYHCIEDMEYMGMSYATHIAIAAHHGVQSDAVSIKNFSALCLPKNAA